MQPYWTVRVSNRLYAFRVLVQGWRHAPAIAQCLTEILLSPFAGLSCSWIDNFHLKDFDSDWRVLGEGAIDFGPVFAAIRDIGFDGWVSTDEESGADFVEAMATCHRFVTEGLG